MIEQTKPVDSLMTVPARRPRSSTDEVLLVLRGLAEVFLAPRGQSLSPQAMALMAEPLAEVEPAALARAAKLALEQCEHMPTPAILRRLAGIQPPEIAAKQAADADAEAAWERLSQYCRQYGPEFLPVMRGGQLRDVLPPGGWDGREAAIARRLGGLERIYWALCERSEAVAFLRRDFLAQWHLEPAVERARLAQPEVLRIAERAAAKLALVGRES